MSKHKMVNGKLLQMNKSYKQLKEKQKTKIGNWMYQAFKRQVDEGLSDDDALDYVFEEIEKAEIWIPDYEIRHQYKAKKNHFRNRLYRENLPRHLFVMEGILDRANGRMNVLEKAIEEFEKAQAEIKKLEEYYTSQQWKDDFAADEEGKYPADLKRGILSEDGIYNMLERNKELLQRIKEEP